MKKRFENLERVSYFITPDENIRAIRSWLYGEHSILLGSEATIEASDEGVIVITEDTRQKLETKVDTAAE